MPDLRYSADGARDGTAFLLVHPWGADRTFWDPFREACGRGFWIACDLRGAGASPVPPEEWPVSRHAADLEAVRAHLGVERVVVVGCALGAVVAATYAARYPEATAALVMSNPAIRTSPEARALLRQRAEDVRRHGMQVLLPGAVDRAFVGCTEEQKRSYTHLFARHDPEGYARFALDYLEADITDDVQRIECPTLLIAGGRDELLPPRNAEEIHMLMPAAELVRMEDAAHFIPYQQPARFAATVSDFLSRRGTHDDAALRQGGAG